MGDKRKETIEKLDRLAEQSSWEQIAEEIDRMEERIKPWADDFWEVADQISRRLEASGRTFSDSTELVREDRDQ